MGKLYMAKRKEKEAQEKGNSCNFELVFGFANL